MAQPGATGSFACCIEIPLTRDWNLDNRIQLFQSSPFSLLCFLFLLFDSTSVSFSFDVVLSRFQMLGDAWRCLAMLGDASLGILGDSLRL